jgi:hypothetical protein
LTTSIPSKGAEDAVSWMKIEIRIDTPLKRSKKLAVSQKKISSHSMNLFQF